MMSLGQMINVEDGQKLKRVLPPLPIKVSKGKQSSILEIDKDLQVLPSVEEMEPRGMNLFKKTKFDNLQATIEDNEEIIDFVASMVKSYLEDSSKGAESIQIEINSSNVVKVNYKKRPHNVIDVDDFSVSPSAPNSLYHAQLKNVECQNANNVWQSDPIIVDKKDGSLRYKGYGEECSYITAKHIRIFNKNKSNFDDVIDKVIEEQKECKELDNYKRHPRSKARVSCHIQKSFGGLDRLCHLYAKHYHRQKTKNLRSMNNDDIRKALLALLSGGDELVQELINCMN